MLRNRWGVVLEVRGRDPCDLADRVNPTTLTDTRDQRSVPNKAVQTRPAANCAARTRFYAGRG